MRLYAAWKLRRRISVAPVFRHAEIPRPVLLDADHIIELPFFRRFRDPPFIDGLMIQEFRGRETVHILDELLDTFPCFLNYLVQCARDPRLHRGHLFIHIRRQPIRRERQRNRRLCRSRWRRHGRQQTVHLFARPSVTRMVLNVVLQDSFGAFLVSTLHQRPRQQRLHHRRLPFAQLHCAIRLLRRFPGLVFL